MIIESTNHNMEGENMDYRHWICLLFISVLLVGTVFAQKTVNDFNIDESYTQAYNGTCDSLYLNGNHDAGVIIYKDLVEVDDDNNAYDNLIQDSGRDYLTPDDDLKIDQNSDNTVNFTDYDGAQHGVAEIIEVNGDSFVVVFWAKDTSNVDNSQLISQLNQFNKDNNVKATAV